MYGDAAAQAVGLFLILYSLAPEFRGGGLGGSRDSWPDLTPNLEKEKRARQDEAWSVIPLLQAGSAGIAVMGEL